MYKLSHYNSLINVDKANQYLLYNILTGGLTVLDNETGNAIAKVDEGKVFDTQDVNIGSDIFDQLYHKGYIVDSYLDEIEEFHKDYILQKELALTENAHIGITIGTTIICNMGCPYCFEFTKPNQSLRDEKVITAIVSYIESMINNAPVKKWQSFTITWYGGEPLVNKEGIKQLSPRLVALCNKYDITYKSSIITNGILLSRDTWHFLKENLVTDVQVTIDGAKEVHDKYRPLKNKTSKNYEKILENLSQMPEGINTIIRVNTDKHVASTFSTMLDDFESYGIWPQRFMSFKIDPAWLRTYEDANERDISGRLTNDEFFDELQKFRHLQQDRFNNWASKNSVNLAKLKWKLPKKQTDCATWVSPFFLVIDPDGGVHKCWETIHSSKDKVTDVFRSWNASDFDFHSAYDRSKLHPTCKTCKFLPVCDGLSCSHEAIHTAKLPCTYWKNRLSKALHDQYLYMIEHPDQISLPDTERIEVQSHANR